MKKLVVIICIIFSVMGCSNSIKGSDIENSNEKKIENNFHTDHSPYILAKKYELLEKASLFF